MSLDRKSIAEELNRIEQAMRELEIKYEQYFAGIEKREPYKDREDIARKIRVFYGRRITFADLRFRFQSLATRFQSYSGYWERILRLIEEGKYHRGKTTGMRPPSSPAAPSAGSASQTASKPEGGSSQPKKSEQEVLKAFYAKNKEKIREKFGDRKVELKIVTKDGKQTIQVRPK